MASATSLDPTSPQMYCSECGGSYAVEDLARFGQHYVCANCKPAYVQRLREGVQPLSASMAGVRYGGFWIRVLAIFIDSLILSVVTVPIAIVLGLGSGALAHFDPQDIASVTKVLLLEAAVGGISLVVALLYQGYFVSQKGGTPGKLALGLRIVNAGTKTNLSVAKSIGRYFAYMLSYIILCIGYIMAAFDSEKRALHDHICNTRVIYK